MRRFQRGSGLQGDGRLFIIAYLTHERFGIEELPFCTPAGKTPSCSFKSKERREIGGELYGFSKLINP